MSEKTDILSVAREALIRHAYPAYENCEHCRLAQAVIDLYGAAREAVDFRGATCHDDAEIENLREVVNALEGKDLGGLVKGGA